MLPDYFDIIKRAGTPDWYDNHGVPRYGEFNPDMLGVYDKFAVLVRIACQACDQEFLVGCGYRDYEFRFSGDIHENSLEEITKNFHYGDPPRHGLTCLAGDTMNCIDLVILEAWEKDSTWEWVRRTELEGQIEPRW